MKPEDFLNLKQAQKLKELGFEEECYAYYLYDDEINFGETPKDYNYIVGNDHISAPTLYQAQKFIYEKYGLWIQINKHLGSDLRKFYFEIREHDNSLRRDSIDIFINPFECLSAGITKALDILTSE